MDLLEADNIDLYSESRHWWIKTRFLYIDKVLMFFRGKKESISILEVGCGTGQNIAYLRNDYKGEVLIKNIYGVDINLPENFSRNDLTAHDVMSTLPPGADQKYDVLIMMDVIEHVEDPVGLIKEYSAYLNTGGQVLVTVPAFQHLWSRHDVILEHIKRYTKSILIDESLKSGLKPIMTRYIFSPFYLIVLFVRKVLPENENVSTDLKLPNFILNNMFYLMGLVESTFSFIKLPFGTSVIGIFKKEN